MPSRKNGRTRRHRKSRLSKLTAKNIGKCAPGNRQKDGKCLPTEIRSRISTTNSRCNSDDEHCLLDAMQEFTANDRELLRKKYLRPRRPAAWLKDPDQWMDNFNISDVMEQYQTAYPWFKFVGVFPIDFSIQDPYAQSVRKCLQPEICNLRILEERAKGTKALGFVFNLDPHNKSGSHWVALYCWIGEGEHWCAYFDSYGYDVPRFIAILMRWLKSQDPQMKLMYNARRFQYGGSECGMFSMYFLICMLNGIGFKEFCKDSVSDEFMLKLRKVLFT